MSTQNTGINVMPTYSMLRKKITSDNTGADISKR
jgi:hypothetical protein